MPRWVIERRLSQVRSRLRKAREQLAVLEEQAAQFQETADDTALQAMVSDSPEDRLEHRDAERHAQAMGASRERLRQEIIALEQAQDDLLDRLSLKHR